ncbi:MAG: CBS domain-containing protein [Armatimonadota bacterium]|nr:CBS domain-containing protein [Armatimonadota bacterium]MDR7440455.1 CBS domain-containing protein [Armatimonadota bacterium]MDR7444605.1 CBS domain-containing protein [Armatimonadota bacterium]MDR7569431.1 CBS domain-containing protein [Armatimonadota bacterium]MDR7613686.1 CBS domain-containing protein [Armatimonadota bacterium]
MLARDIMTKDVITLDPSLTVEEAADVLIRYRIHGAPVVDQEERLVGMVSLVDLVAKAGSRVRDIMTPDPVTASEDTPLAELAQLMLDEMVRRVPIVRGSRVVGIVSASDFLRAYLELVGEGRAE